MAPAQGADVLIEGTSAFTVLWEVSTRERVFAALFVKENNLSPFAPLTLNTLPWYEKPDFTKVRQVDIHMQGGALRNLMNAAIDGIQHIA